MERGERQSGMKISPSSLSPQGLRPILVIEQSSVSCHRNIGQIMIEHVQIWSESGQNISQLLPQEAHPLSGSLPGDSRAKEADFAGKGVDLNDFASLFHLAADASLEFYTTVDQVLDKCLLGSGVTRNPLLPQFLIALPVLPWKSRVTGTAFGKTA
jgi:hypothetical protein